MREPSQVLRLAIAVVLLIGTSGCYCQFRAFRATMEHGKVNCDETDEVPLSLFAPDSIPIYREERDNPDTPYGELPDRAFVVVGVVRGIADDHWPRSVVESNYRRAARALHGDAVVINRGVFSKLHSGYTYYGEVIRWRADAAASAETP